MERKRKKPFFYRADRGETALWELYDAGQYFNPNLSALLLNGADISHHNNKGETVLWSLWRSNDGFDSKLGELLANGADINNRDNKGETILHATVRRFPIYNNTPEVVYSLVAAGVDVDCKCNSGKTAQDILKETYTRESERASQGKKTELETKRDKVLRILAR